MNENVCLYLEKQCCQCKHLRQNLKGYRSWKPQQVVIVIGAVDLLKKGQGTISRNIKIQELQINLLRNFCQLTVHFSSAGTLLFTSSCKETQTNVSSSSWKLQLWCAERTRRVSRTYWVKLNEEFLWDSKEREENMLASHSFRRIDDTIIHWLAAPDCRSVIQHIGHILHNCLKI